MLSVSASHECLPEACERALSLGEIRGMTVESFRGLHMALGLSAELPLERLELGLFLGRRAFARLETREHSLS
jgi:hypothetical protein